MNKTYVQFIVLDKEERLRREVAKEWLELMCGAIRQYDPNHMITLGLVDWSIPGAPKQSGFLPNMIKEQLDFISCHLYPIEGKVDEMLEVLKRFCVEKPVVLDETFHFMCGVEDHIKFLTEASRRAQGFMTFYTDYNLKGQDDGRQKWLSETFEIHQRVKKFYKTNF